MAKMGRPPNEPFSGPEIQAVIDALTLRIRKLNAIQRGMKDAKLQDVDLAPKKSMEETLNWLNRACDTGLDQLRAVVDRTKRSWDEWH